MKTKSACLIVLLSSCLQPQTQQVTSKKSIDFSAYLQQRNGVAPLNASIIIGNKDTVLFKKFFGFEDVATNKPIDSTTVFPIASGSKPFTAAAILMLHDQKKLTIDDPVNKWLLGFPSSWKGITIRHLLSHTSGIPDWLRVAPDEQFAVNASSLAGLYTNIPPDTAPGEKFSYGNINYLLLSFIIEKAAAIPFERFIDSSIIRPLSLKNTGFVYEYTGSRMAKGYHDAFSMRPITEKEAVNYRLLKGAGGMYSTAADIIVFQSRLKDILLRGTFLLMVEPVKEDYALGWHVQKQMNKTVIKHPGGINGYCSEMRYIVEDDLSIVILSNVRLNDLNIRYAAFDLFKMMNGGFSEANIPVATKYFGKYALPDDFAKKAGVRHVTIQNENQRIVVKVPGKNDSYLVPFERDKFFFYGEATNAEFSADANELRILSPSYGVIICKKIN